MSDNDYVRIYRERFWNLWNLLKKIFKSNNYCNQECNQGRTCDCKERQEKRLKDWCDDQRY